MGHLGLSQLDSLSERGVAIVFGPVADPSGGYGIGVIEAKDEAEMLALQADDPAIKTGIGHRYEKSTLCRE